MNKNLYQALHANLNYLETNCNPLLAIAATDRWGKANEFYQNEIMACDDVLLLKKLAIKFDGYQFFYATEDRLCELLGNDVYFDWADNNLD